MSRPREEAWDLVDRLLLPVLFSHAAAVLLSTVLSVLRIANVSTFALFFWIVSAVLAAVLFYHNLKVTAAGKAVLITGCESKIGYALVKQLDELGFTVFAGFLYKYGTEARRLKEECSGRLHVLQLDVTSEIQVREAKQYVQENLPPDAPGVWAVINNATWANFGDVEWVPFSVFQRSIEVNLMGTINVTQAFLPLLRKTKGRVVNVVSILGRITTPSRSCYCAVKSGVEAFSECLHLEMRKWGVDVVLVEPGDYTTVNAWLTDDKLLQQAKVMWGEMSKDARNDYGEDYFEKKIRSLEKYTKGPDADLGPIMKSLLDSVTRTFPLPRYTPVTRAEKIQALVAQHLPRSVYDIIYN